MGDKRNNSGRGSGALRLAFALCCVCFLPLKVWAYDVVVVSSDVGPGYSEASDAFAEAVQRRGVKPQDVLPLLAADVTKFDFSAKPSTRVLVTLGTNALREVLQKGVELPVLAGLVPRSSVEALLLEAPKGSSRSVTALYLDQPLGRQLDALRLAMPSAKRVGVVLGPESANRQSAFLAAARQRALTVSLGETVDATGLAPALRSALEGADVLFAMPDAQVYNSNTLANVLIAAYRLRIPVVGFSPAYVRAGALMSLHSTPAQVGSQLGQWAHTVLQGGKLPEGGQYPADFSIAVNVNVARSLGLSLDATRLEAAVRAGERSP